MRQGGKDVQTGRVEEKVLAWHLAAWENYIQERVSIAVAKPSVGVQAVSSACQPTSDCEGNDIQQSRWLVASKPLRTPCLIQSSWAGWQGKEEEVMVAPDTTTTLLRVEALVLQNPTIR
jgi:hypothetical protein